MSVKVMKRFIKISMNLSEDQKMMIAPFLIVKTFSAALIGHTSFQFWVREGDSFLLWVSFAAVVLATIGTAVLIRMYQKGVDFVPYIRRMIGGFGVLGSVYCASLIIWGVCYLPKIASIL